jgi:hypothetical protein
MAIGLKARGGLKGLGLGATLKLLFKCGVVNPGGPAKTVEEGKTGQLWAVQPYTQFTWRKNRHL